MQAVEKGAASMRDQWRARGRGGGGVWGGGGREGGYLPLMYRSVQAGIRDGGGGV